MLVLILDNKYYLMHTSSRENTVLSKLLKRKSDSDSIKVSLIIQTASVTLAVVGGDTVFIKQLPCANNDFCTAIRQLVLDSDVELAQAQCQIVLGHGLFQLAQLDKPNVPENEIAQALLWGAKDLVAIASDNILLDYFEYLSNNPNGSKINVVACDQAVVKPVTDLLLELAIDIKGISIVDIVLSQLHKEEAPKVVVFHLPGINVVVAIIKQGQLCFSRNVKGYDNLHQMSYDDFQAGMLNNLGLEIQRCIDFSVGQLKLEPVKGVALVVQSLDGEHMVSALQELFDIEVEMLETSFDPAFDRYPLSALALAEMEYLG